jgi:hypothetical protein
MQSIIIDKGEDCDFPEPEESYNNNGCFISSSIILLYLVTMFHYIIYKGV